MLTGMINALALTARDQPFNGLFYATAATAIPVLFLAIAVQGTTYENLLASSARMAGPLLRNLWRLINDPGPRLRDLAAALLYVGIASPVLSLLALLPAAIAAAVLLSGFSGEAEALIALYHQRSPTGPISVLTAALILTAGVAAGPALRFARYFFWTPQPHDEEQQEPHPSR